MYSKNKIVLFQDDSLELKVNVSPEQDTVWLSRSQMAESFDRDIKTIGKHINNVLKEELDFSVVAKFATTADDGKTYQVEYKLIDDYTLVALTIMIAESHPEEKEMMVSVIMNCIAG